jgi:5'-nucleotidase (lipoprotein e(P4) family)
MKKNKLITLAITGSALLLGGCAAHNTENTVQKNNANKVTFTQQSVLAYDWLEHSGEAEALRYQAYNMAKRNLGLMVLEQSAKPKAVILDIDETSLDNGDAAAYQIKHNIGFNQTFWNKWVGMSDATPIPGAVSFTQYAKSMGVQVFYVSNRNANQINATRKNLVKWGFADASEAGHIVLSTGNSDKQPRFDKIEQKYNVVQFFGDQLTDFGQLFENKTNVEQQAEVKKIHTEFGWKFYQIPNPTYGEWETHLLHNNYNQTDAQKVALAQAPADADAFILPAATPTK